MALLIINQELHRHHYLRATYLTATKDQQILSKMPLLDLPSELIYCIIDQVSTPTDMFSLSQTCHFFHDTCTRHKMKHHQQTEVPRVQQMELYVLAHTARKLTAWALASPENQANLYKSLLDGYEGLYRLSNRVIGYSLSDLRTIYRKKITLIDPLVSKLHHNSGFPKPAVWNAIMHYWIYCELFHHHFDDFQSKSKVQLSLGIARRFWSGHQTPSGNGWARCCARNESCLHLLKSYIFHKTSIKLMCRLKEHFHAASNCVRSRAAIVIVHSGEAWLRMLLTDDFDTYPHTVMRKRIQLAAGEKVRVSSDFAVAFKTGWLIA